jgi:formamidopyrimidine-DNA glycosylase
LPELPEVEVVRMGLEAQLTDARLCDLQIFTPTVIPFSEQAQTSLIGQHFRAFRRRGKYLIIDLDQGHLLIHLRMTGQVLIIPPNAEALLPLPFTYYQRPLTGAIDKHTHGCFAFDNGMQMTYRDIRKFGRVEYLDEAQLQASKSLNKLGPEPLSTAFTKAAFARALKKTQRAIKAVLLDQRVVAGLGNIYVDEALFLAGIHPLHPAARLSAKTTTKLFEAIPFVLQKGIDAGGTSLKDYLHPDGSRGSHQEHLFVYGRTGQNCQRCQTPLVKSVVAQRGTHHCPRCQKQGNFT